MKVTLNIVLYKGKLLSDGTYPIQLQLHVPGEPSQRKGIYKCKESDWDKSKSRLKGKAPNSAYANNFISEEYARHERKLLKVLNGEISHLNFFGNSEEKLSLDRVIKMEMERFTTENKPGTYKRYESFRKEFLLFKSDKTNIEIINIRWFQDFAVFLSSEISVSGKVVKKKNIGSTAQGKIKAVRRMVARYSKKETSEDVKNFRINHSPNKKIKLTALEVKILEDIDLIPGSHLDICRDFFLMQIYLRGSRVGALVQAYSKQFDNGRYEEYNQQGEKTNVGCKLIPKAQAIVDKYYGKHDRLFPVFRFKPNPEVSEFENNRRRIKQKESATLMINRGIKEVAAIAGIDKNISTHIARHTFARMAINKINNPMVSMELLGHKSLSVHQAYLNEIRQDDVLDAAADDIFS